LQPYYHNVSSVKKVCLQCIWIVSTLFYPTFRTLFEGSITLNIGDLTFYVKPVNRKIVSDTWDKEVILTWGRLRQKRKNLLKRGKKVYIVWLSFCQPAFFYCRLCLIHLMYMYVFYLIINTYTVCYFLY